MNLPRRLALPSLLVGLIITFLLQVRPFSATKKFRVLVPVTSDTEGRARLAWRSVNSTVQPDTSTALVAKGPQVLSFTLPFTTTYSFRFRAKDAIASLRLDPLDRIGRITLGTVSVIDPDEKIVATFQPSGFSTPKPGPDLKPDGDSVAFTNHPGDGVLISPEQPLQLALRALPFSPRSAVLQFAGATLATSLVLFLASLLPAARRARLTATLAKLRDDSAAWPALTLFLTAALATMASCYPIIFCGKSFISPNFGPTQTLTNLLPEAAPQSQESVENSRGADTGATMWAHLPYSVIQHRAIFKHHELPLWNRYTFCGTPLLAQGQSMLGDPLHWIPVAAGGATWAWDVKFCIAKLLFSFGVGLAAFAATRRVWIAVLLAVSSSFIGFFAFRFDHAAYFSLCYSPWILLCWLRAAQTAGRVWPWALALAAANFWELNSGTAKESAMLLAGLNLTGGLLVLASSHRRRDRLARLVLMLVGIVLFAMLSAPHWMLFLDALRHSWAASAKMAFTQLPPNLAPGIFDDLFFAQALPGEIVSNPSANFLVLLGCLWAVVDFRRLLADRTFVAILLGAVLPPALAFGIIPAELLMRLKWIGKIGHVANTFSCVLIIHLFVIAAFGLRSLWERVAGERARADMLIAALCATLLAAFFLPHVRAIHVTSGKISVFFCAYAIALGAALLAMPCIVRGIRLRPSAAHFIAGGLCLFVFHFRHGLWTDTKFDGYVANPRSRASLAAISPAAGIIRTSFEESGHPARTAGFGGVFAPGFNIVSGLENFDGADALVNRWQRELLEQSSVPLAQDRRTFLNRATFPRTRSFGDLWNTRFYLSDPAETPRNVKGLELVKTLDLDIHVSHRAWPRAFFTDRLAECSSLENFTELLCTGDGKPFAAMVPDVPSDAEPGKPASLDGRIIVAASGYRLTENSTAFTIDAPAAGVAVLGNSFEPGNWRVTLDGTPAECFRVNHAFLGVKVPAAGVHTLRFSYWPRLLTRALWISLGGFLFVLAMIFGGVQPRQKITDDEPKKDAPPGAGT